MEMRDIARFGIILMVVAALSAGSLAVVRNVTEERTKKVLEEEKQKALLEVLPAAKVFEPTTHALRGYPEVRNGKMKEAATENSILYYVGYESRNRKKVIGYAFIAEGKGYSSTIKTMVGITPEGEITGLKILSQQETPGLGARIEEVPSGKTIRDIFRRDVKKSRVDEKPWFQKQFVGKKSEDIYSEKMEAITGATISSKAVIDSVREKIDEIASSLHSSQ